MLNTCERTTICKVSTAGFSSVVFCCVVLSSSSLAISRDLVYVTPTNNARVRCALISSMLCFDRAQHACLTLPNLAKTYRSHALDTPAISSSVYVHTLHLARVLGKHSQLSLCFVDALNRSLDRGKARQWCSAGSERPFPAARHRGSRRRWCRH